MKNNNCCHINFDEIVFCHLHAAAPELLAALEWCRSEFTILAYSDLSDTMKKIDAAIAKATGGAP